MKDIKDELFAMHEESEENNENQVETAKKHLAFFSDGLQYAIDVDYVNEIITNYNITPLPKLPSFIKGIMNLRGQITPVIDIRLLMNRPQADKLDTSCIIVVENNGVILGVLVDGVSRVINLSPEMISPAPSSADQELIYGIANVEGAVNLLLDCRKLIQNEVV